MNIAVICVESVSNRPPVQQLLLSLLTLGHEVLFISRDTAYLPEQIKSDRSLRIVELGEKPHGIKRYLQVIRDKRKIRDEIDKRASSLDLIWCATEMSARDSKAILNSIPYVIQMPELVEFIPAFRIGNHYIHDKTLPEITRAANAVVVPEYNRAHIQKTWWNLSETPFVLPNKSEIEQSQKTQTDTKLHELFESEQKKILLYQGGFTPDRDLLPFAKATNLLSDDYALYLMGPINNKDEQDIVDHLVSIGENIRYVGFVEAPDHKLYTHYGYIGILPYSPSTDNSRASSLNALYCAPNKIWEYAEAGLPMLGSDVPGLTSLFVQNNLGITVDQTSTEDIARGIELLSNNYDTYREGSANYYKMADPTSIIEQILKKAS